MAMRLQKYLARAGVASRRASEGLIAQGHVSVNGEIVTKMGTTIDESVDEVRVDGQPVTLSQEDVTIMLHKPAGYVTTMSDPQGRPIVADLVPTDVYPSLYPIGRLDVDTTGLLLFSTDGELGQVLLHPRHHVMKRYLAHVEGTMQEADVRRLRMGVKLDDGMTLPAEADVLAGDAAFRAADLIDDDSASSGGRRRRASGRAKSGQSGSYVAISLREGRKRQVRRMLEAVGHPVIALHRVSFGSLDLGDLPRGAWRKLTDEEVSALRDSAQYDE